MTQCGRTKSGGWTGPGKRRTFRARIKVGERGCVGPVAGRRGFRTRGRVGGRSGGGGKVLGMGGITTWEGRGSREEQQ